MKLLRLCLLLLRLNALVWLLRKLRQRQARYVVISRTSGSLTRRAALTFD